MRAVDGVSLEVDAGEVLALVGESGCGKTTLIRSVLGLEPMAGGAITFAGEPVRRSHGALRALRRNVQMVFQDPTGALNPRHTIYEAVAEGIRIHRIKGNEPALVAEALSRAGLRPPERFMARFPHEVSGGQRQRVLIAGALALGPNCCWPTSRSPRWMHRSGARSWRCCARWSTSRASRSSPSPTTSGWRGTSPTGSP